MERNLRRYKNKKYPKTPKTVKDLVFAYQDSDITQKFGRNLRKTEEFYIDTFELGPDTAFTLFASHQVLNLAKEHIPFEDQIIMMDGTFDITPLGYYQLLVIYIQYKNDVGFNLFSKALALK